MSIDMKALRALLAKATPGKWETDGDMAMYVFARQGRTHTMVADRNVGYDPDAPAGSIVRARGTGAGLTADQQSANVRLVAAAVNALPALLDLAEAVRELNSVIVRITDPNDDSIDVTNSEYEAARRVLAILESK